MGKDELKTHKLTLNVIAQMMDIVVDGGSVMLDGWTKVVPDPDIRARYGEPCSFLVKQGDEPMTSYYGDALRLVSLLLSRVAFHNGADVEKLPAVEGEPQKYVVTIRE